MPASIVLPGMAPTIIFLPGFRSTMTGRKATHLDDWCRDQGRACVRFDYSGHGVSAGDPLTLTVGDWLADTLRILDAHGGARCILVGSSMGGWLAVLATLARPTRVAGLILLAPAPDFPDRLILPSLAPSARARLARDGRLELASPYGPPLLVTDRLVVEARAHAILGRELPLACPVHILHGRLDREVPWQLSLELIATMCRAQVTLEIVEDGDHRLSRDGDLKRLDLALAKVLKLVDSG